jgi:hypothetical protein
MSRFELIFEETAQEMFERRAKQAESRQKKLDKIEKSGYCEGVSHKCDNRDGVEWVDGRTFYQWNIDEDPDEDPNRDRFLCPGCAKEWNDYWDEMWNEYYYGRL